MRFSRRMKPVATGVLMLIVLAFTLGGCGETQNHVPQVSDEIYGPVGAELSSPDGLTVTVDKIERTSAQWLVHLRAHNTSVHTLQIIGSGTGHQFVHQFVLLGTWPVGTPTPAEAGIVQLDAPAGADLATHPAFPATLSAGASTEGWLMADLTKLSNYLPPTRLQYHYASVSTTACKDPTDRSTCHPATLYEDLTWNVERL